MKENDLTDVTLFVIDENKIIEKEGLSILPQPHRLIDVQLSNSFMARACEAQRECEEKGESFVIRLLDDEGTNPPIFASDIVSIRVIDLSIPFRMARFNWKN